MGLLIINLQMDIITLGLTQLVKVQGCLGVLRTPKHPRFTLELRNY